MAADNLQCQFKLLMLTYKALCTHFETWILEGLIRVHRYHSTHALCSTEETLLCALLADKAQLAGTTERAFSVPTPRPWNSLPRDTHLVPSLLTAQHKVKTELHRQAFN